MKSLYNYISNIFNYNNTLYLISSNKKDNSDSDDINNVDIENTDYRNEIDVSDKIINLPNIILKKIVLYLKDIDMLSFPLVCKRWYLERNNLIQLYSRNVNKSKSSFKSLFFKRTPLYQINTIPKTILYISEIKTNIPQVTYFDIKNDFETLFIQDGIEMIVLYSKSILEMKMFEILKAKIESKTPTMFNLVLIAPLPNIVKGFLPSNCGSLGIFTHYNPEFQIEDLPPQLERLSIAHYSRRISKEVLPSTLKEILLDTCAIKAFHKSTDNLFKNLVYDYYNNHFSYFDQRFNTDSLPLGIQCVGGIYATGNSHECFDSLKSLTNINVSGVIISDGTSYGIDSHPIIPSTVTNLSMTIRPNSDMMIVPLKVEKLELEFIRPQSFSLKKLFQSSNTSEKSNLRKLILGNLTGYGQDSLEDERFDKIEYLDISKSFATISNPKFIPKPIKKLKIGNRNKIINSNETKMIPNSVIVLDIKEYRHPVLEINKTTSVTHCFIPSTVKHLKLNCFNFYQLNKSITVIPKTITTITMISNDKHYHLRRISSDNFLMVSKCRLLLYLNVGFINSNQIDLLFRNNDRL